MKTQKKAVAMIIIMIFVSAMQVDQAQAATATDGVSMETSIQEIISLDCGAATVNMGNITPGIPVTGSSTCTSTTNATNGYNLAVRRDDGTDTTMDKASDDTVNISDFVSWDPTANANDGNAIAWTGTGLGFTVFYSSATKNEDWWGNGINVTDPANRYAGFSASQREIMRHNGYSNTSTTTSIGYKLDIPYTQKSGAYAGSITYQAITNP